VVEGNCKWWSRIRVLGTLVEELGRQLNFKPSKTTEAKSGSKKKKGKRR